jgi:hypothetical protein
MHHKAAMAHLRVQSHIMMLQAPACDDPSVTLWHLGPLDMG